MILGVTIQTFKRHKLQLSHYGRSTSRPLVGGLISHDLKLHERGIYELIV